MTARINEEADVILVDDVETGVKGRRGDCQVQAGEHRVGVRNQELLDMLPSSGHYRISPFSCHVR